MMDAVASVIDAVTIRCSIYSNGNVNAQTVLWMPLVFIVTPYLIHFTLLSRILLCIDQELWIKRKRRWNTSALECCVQCMQLMAIVTWSINGSMNYGPGDYSVRLLELGQICFCVCLNAFRTSRRLFLCTRKKKCSWSIHVCLFFSRFIFLCTQFFFSHCE